MLLKESCLGVAARCWPHTGFLNVEWALHWRSMFKCLFCIYLSSILTDHQVANIRMVCLSKAVVLNLPSAAVLYTAPYVVTTQNHKINFIATS